MFEDEHPLEGTRCVMAAFPLLYSFLSVETFLFLDIFLFYFLCHILGDRNTFMDYGFNFRVGFSLFFTL
jgi:hypothetical protein